MNSEQLFEINRLIPKELLGIDNVNSLSLFHQFFRYLLVGCEVASIACEKSESAVRGISAN